jgi:uncharacterized protein (TIGR02246 family)
VTDIAEARTALASVEARWNAAGAPWDPQALANVYTEDAVFFGGRPGHSVGRDAIRGYFASYDGVIASGVMELVEPVILPLAPGLVLAQGHVDFSFVLAGDKRTRSLLRATLVLAKRGERWLILQHHFSPTPETPPLGDKP